MVFIKYLQIAVETKIFSNLNLINGNTLFIVAYKNLFIKFVVEIC